MRNNEECCKRTNEDEDDNADDGNAKDVEEAEAGKAADLHK